MRRENEIKENGKKENEKKHMFYLYVFGWRENKEKEN